MLSFELNGYPVLRSETHENGYTTILVKRGENSYVVATWWPELKNSWSWGHYETDYAKTVDVYNDVNKSNSQRGKVA